jgi:hypothetical protein
MDGTVTPAASANTYRFSTGKSTLVACPGMDRIDRPLNSTVHMELIASDLVITTEDGHTLRYVRQ